MNKAVESIQTAPEEDKSTLENLAFRWALKDPRPEIRKKLWLKIAMGFKNDEKKIKEILARPRCPLKIPDVLSLFDEDQNIGPYKELIESSLSEYDKRITDYNAKLQSYQKVSDYFKQENSSLAKRFFVFDLDKNCDVCFTNIFTDVFYTFNCSHSFHRSCVEQKLIEFGAGERVLRIHELEGGMQKALQKYGSFMATSELKRKRGQFRRRVQKVP